MKKFLAITASAVLAFGALAFTACGDKQEEDAANLTYKEVDLSTPEKRSAFVEEVTDKVDFNTMFGDTTVENFSFGLATDMKFNFDLSASMKDFPVSETETKDLSLSAKLENSQSANVKAFADGSLLGESHTTVKLNASLPDELYAMAEMPEELEAMVKSLITDFNYTITEYIDNEYLYAQLPQEFMDIIPEEAAGILPESGKIKIPYGLGGNYVPPVVESYAVAPTEDSQTAAMVAGIMEMLAAYNVKVAVSTENGYAIRLTADKDVVMNVLSGVTGDPQTVAMINQFATFNTCALTAYLAVDNDGMFKEVSISIDLDVAVKIEANLIEVGMPEINAALKTNVEMSVKTFNGNITLPSDLDSYVDISAMM